MRAPSGLPECVRVAAGPQRGTFPVVAARPHRSCGTPVPAGRSGARDDLADRHGLDDRAGRAGHVTLVRRRGTLHHASPDPVRLGGRAHAVAHGALRERDGRPVRQLRTRLRLPPRPHRMELYRQGLRGGHRGMPERAGRTSDAAHDDGSAPRNRGPRGPRATSTPQGRHGLRRIVVVGLPDAAHLRRGRRQDDRHPGLLARVDHDGPLPGSPVAHLPAEQRSDAQGTDLQPDRGAARSVDDLTPRNTWRRT